MQLATPNGVGYRVWYRAIGSGWQGPLQFQGMERPHPKGKSSSVLEHKAWTGWQSLSLVTGTALSIG